MAILFTFLLGIGNFAIHKAVLESGHPMLGKMPWFVHMLGGRVSMATEFLILLAALLMGSVPAWRAYRQSLADGLSIRL